MNAEFFGALEQLERDKGIPMGYMLDKVCQALLVAYKKDHAGVVDNVVVEPDVVKKQIKMYAKKQVVDDLYDPLYEITLEEALKISKKCSVGDIINVEVKTKQFGRIAAQTARQIITQGIREVERGMVLNEFASKEHEILSATVNKIDPRNGNLILEVMSQGEKVEAVLSKDEMVPGETFKDGQMVKIYVVEVKKGSRGPQVLISRTHPGLVKRLFELEVPEIAEGLVEIRSIAREAGNRTKIAVYTENPDIDPIGACVGIRGARSKVIGEELFGEKIDIVLYSEDLGEFVRSALAPSDVDSVTVNPDNKSCRVIVPDDQLSLAIGKGGQNARLAAKLTGCKIDIASSITAKE